MKHLHDVGYKKLFQNKVIFRELLETIGIDMNRIHFSWISAAEGKKFQEFVTEIVDKTKQLGPYEEYKSICGT